ncbi:MAG: glycosyltransferase [Syntrophobacteria bacterium]
MTWICLGLVGAAIWLGILLSPWRPWSTRESLNAASAFYRADLSDITVLIPARNEVETIQATLAALKAQDGDLNIVLIDDRSEDETTKRARSASLEKLVLISGQPLPEGWTGKLWALEQGLHQVNTPLTFLMDADIVLRPGLLATLRERMRKDNFQFISLMAALQMQGFWEQMLIPAFVYFFKLLYPFRLCNCPASRVAGAAGGCILLETRVLDEIGGFQALRGELIDDCALARRVKSLGYRTWIGLTHSVHSLRHYPDLKGIWNMVARTAFAQLRYSPLLLGLCTAVMVTAFLVPIGVVISPHPVARLVATVALGAMMLSYLPILRFYQMSGWRALTIPLVGTLYLAMTWSSAIRYWQGKGSRWKGRVYSRSLHSG